MSRYIENDDRIIFHPGYYIEEFVDESGLTKEGFAEKVEMSSEDFELLIEGKKSLSEDMAVKLARVMGTSVEYWMNLQNRYDGV